MRHLLRSSLALLLLLAVACGGSDGGSKAQDAKDAKDTSSSTTAAPAGSTSTTVRILAKGEVDASASPFCGVWARILDQGGPDVEGTPAEVSQKLKDHYRPILPMARELASKAPKEVAAAAALVAKEVDEVIRTGSFDPFTTPEATAAQEKLRAYTVEHCARG